MIERLAAMKHGTRTVSNEVLQIFGWVRIDRFWWERPDGVRVDSGYLPNPTMSLSDTYRLLPPRWCDWGLMCSKVKRGGDRIVIAYVRGYPVCRHKRPELAMTMAALRWLAGEKFTARLSDVKAATKARADEALVDARG